MVISLINHAKSNLEDASSLTTTGAKFRLDEGCYVLDFIHSLYKVKQVGFAITNPSYACLVVTFKKTHIGDDPEYIFSTKDGERGLLVNGNKLEILGVVGDRVVIPYILEEWNIMFIQWSVGGDNMGYYQINDEKGSFKTNIDFSHPPANEIYIGASYNNGQPKFFFRGSIAVMDVFCAQNSPEKELPLKMRELIIQDHHNRVWGFQRKKKSPDLEKNYFGNTEDFRRDQVAFWFCADYWFSVTFHDRSKFVMEKVANLSMYKSFAAKSMYYSSRQRGYLRFKEVRGHSMKQEHDMPWRTNPTSLSDETMYHRYFAVDESRYVIDYPLTDNVCIFMVYKIDKLEGDEEEENYLFTNGTRGICVSHKKLRIHGVDNERKYLDFDSWGDLKSPTIPKVWNVIAIWWNGVKSSLWVNGGVGLKGEKVLTFEAINDGSDHTVIGNSVESRGGHGLIGGIKNIEIYNKELSENFIFARMKYLTLQYGIEDSVYK